MEKKALFRTNILGAYNRQDVDDYIKRLEDELIRVQREKEGMNDRKPDLPQERQREAADIMVLDETRGVDYRDKKPLFQSEEVKQREQDTYRKPVYEEKRPVKEIMEEPEDSKKEKESRGSEYKTIKEMLLNAYADAEKITAEAQNKARLIAENAQKQIMDTYKETLNVLARCLEENQSSLAASRRYLEEQIKNIDSAQKEISVLEEGIKKFLSGKNTDGNLSGEERK